MSSDIKPNLGKYSSKDFSPGASLLTRVLWYLINSLVFKSYFFPFSRFKSLLLKIFGSKIGDNVNIKPNINIKYPWNLDVGNNVWIGEGVWIDNLAKVSIGSNVCISQSAYILTGSHNYKDSYFGLITKPVVIHDGCWICAKAVLCPGIEMKLNSILLAGSVLTKSTVENCIYQGNPANNIRTRTIN